MISFQFVFGIIFLNFFVAVIIEGFDETAIIENANLSQVYLDRFKQHWAEYDAGAKGLIRACDLKPLLEKL